MNATTTRTAPVISRATDEIDGASLSSMSMVKTYISLAWRNLWRNRRRSLVTVSSLACGFAAVALFAGYTHATYTALGNTAIHAEGIGHLTINRNGWETQGKLHPEKFLLTPQEISSITAIVQQSLPGAHVLPRLGVSGLLSNGRSSTIFLANGIAPADQLVLRGPFRNAPGQLDPAKPSGVTLAQGLADVLGFKVGDGASVLVSTVHGQANAADIDVGDTVDTGTVATNDKLMTLPLALAQSLMDAPGRADLLTVVLDDPNADPAKTDPRTLMAEGFRKQPPSEAQSKAQRDLLNTRFQAAGLDVQVRTWQEMSAFFRQVKSLYDMIFALMLTVVLAIVVLSIANAMSMAVVERTREIGTLRAIGLRRAGIAKLFVSEALMLVLVGTLSGLALAALARWGVNTADIRYVPPSSTSPVPVYIGIDVARTALAGVVLAVLAVAAAYLPARKAAQQPIIESLGHV